MQKKNIVEQSNLLSLHWKEIMREMEIAQVTFFGELRMLLEQEMKKAAQSTGSQYAVENVKITNVEGDKRGHESLTEMGVIVEGRKPIDGMQQWQTPYQLSNGYNGSGTEMGMGGRFEGRKPNDELSVQHWHDIIMSRTMIM